MRRRATLSLLVAPLCALPLASWPSSSAALPSASFSPCPQQPAFSCTTVQVPLDRTGAVTGTVALKVERHQSTPGPSRDAVVALAGGPGQATLPLARFIAEAISPALGSRDLLVFDQRGTGSSGPLTCPALSPRELASSHSLGEVIQRCARQIGPARGAYTTTESVEDLEAIRQATGYERLVLYGTSYGTKVALQYAQRYPQHVASLVLDSTETPEGPDPFHVGTFKAIGPVLRELCSFGACRRVTRDPLADLAHLVSQTNARRLVGRAFDGHGRPTSRSITTRGLFELLLAGDLNPALRAQVPSAVRAAVGHDLGPLARMLTVASINPPHEEGAAGDDAALFIDTSCEETRFPWQRNAPEATRAVEAEAALNALPVSDFYPFDAESALLDMTIPICVGWPDASSPPAQGGPVPAVPTLILSGDQDLRTPSEDAQRVAAMISGAQLLRVPYTGHSVIGSDLTGCAKAAVAAFFEGVAVKPCSGTVDPFPPAPLAPRAFSSVAPVGHLPTVQGRTVAAVVGSLLDARRTLVSLALDFGQFPAGASFGGLRGGSVSVSRTGARLRHFSYVPGVQISGFLPTAMLVHNAGSAASVTVSGAQAAGGRLRLQSGGRISGVLSGRRFHVTVAGRAAAARAGSTTGAQPEGLAGGPTAFTLPALARVR